MAFHYRFFLRVAVRSTILCLLLLSLVIVTPAKAAGPSFTEVTGAGNPLNVDVGSYTSPTLADVDGDGDLDAFIGENDGNINYYKNIGTATAPSFIVQTGANNPLNAVAVQNHSRPTLADIDGDGDLDAFISFNYGTILFYRNDGTATAPSFTAVTGSGNPFNGVDVGSQSALTLGDIDGDGDLDAFIGRFEDAIMFYRNDGTAIAPSFVLATGADNPLNGVNVGEYSAPTLADVDSDGDLDVFIGEWLGNINFYRNDGTAAVPSFNAVGGSGNPLNGVDVGEYSSPALGDIDGDGDLDALIGDYDPGLIRYFRNDDTASNPNLGKVTDSTDPFYGFWFSGQWSSPALGDLDGDGDLDAVNGINTGFDNVIQYYQNIGTVITPTFSLVEDANAPFYGVSLGQSPTPTLGDVDGDGDLDAFVGISDGTLQYYQNTGTVITPTFSLVEEIDAPFYGLNVGGNPAPTLADVDGDGDLDAIIGIFDGAIQYYQNTGTVITPTFSLVTGANDPFNGVDVGMKSAPTLADVDGDGDLDAFIGAYDGAINFYQNIGTVITPTFSVVTGWDNPFNGEDVGSASTPTLGDLDGDGDLDALIGGRDAVINYYRNALPEMAVIGNSQIVVDGDSTPAVADDTDFGSVTIGEAITHTFTISNTGLGKLTLIGNPLISLSGAGAGDFSVVAQPTTLIESGATTTFQIRYTPSVTVTQVATVTIANNDVDESPYDFAIQGIGLEPEMAVISNNLIIVDGDATPMIGDQTDFSIASLGDSITHTFTISNTGLGDLILTGSPFISLSGAGAVNFSAVVQPTTPVDPYTTTTFQIRFTPLLTMTQVATVTIANNDVDENPYDFAIQGIGLEPEMAVIGNNKVILDGDTSPNIDDHTDFGNVLLGEAITHTFTISNSDLGKLNLTGVPLVFLSGDDAVNFSVVLEPDSPVYPDASTTFQIRYTPSVTMTQVATVTIANNDVDENPYDFAIQGTGALPEMAVIGNGQEIADGDSTPAVADNTDFGSVISGESITHTFTISNSGLGNLQVTGSPLVSLSGDGAGDFSVVVSPTTPVAPDATSTFQISFTPSVTMTQVATVTLANTDSDENPYDFAIRGIMGIPEMAVIGNGQEIADGDALPTVDDHTDFGNLGLGASVTHTFTISNSGNAELLLNGSPMISLSGVGASDFSIVTQPVTPVEPGTTTTFQIRFTPSITVTQTATVTIANNDSDENPYEFAIQGSTELPEMAVIGNSQIIADGDVTPVVDDYTDFGSVEIGDAITRTFTISNTGFADLNLTGDPLVSLTGAGAGDFSVVAQPVTPVSPAGTTTFQIRFIPSVTETQAVTVTIANNDSDENPYEFTIQGSGEVLNWRLYLPVLFMGVGAE